VSLEFDGKLIPALAGETVAAALSAAGVLRLRDTAAGAPRGLHCGMGACFDCVVTIDGRIGQRACLAEVADGMRVTSGAHLPLADLAEPPPPGEDVATVVCDVLVVGAGPAGLAAGIAAAEAGADVIVLDERHRPGGQYLKPLAASHADAAPDAQARAGDALRARAARAGLRLEGNASVWGGFATDELAAVVDGRAVTYRPRRLILAPGAHAGPMPLPGWTLPGVLTTGGLQTLARAQRVSPGARVVIAGSGPLNLQLACELLAGGVHVAAVVEAAPRPRLGAVLPLLRHAPDLAWAGLRMIVRLRRAGVPVLWGSRVTALAGGDRVAAAQVATPTGLRAIPAEVVALNSGFQPEVGLARALGVPHRFVDISLGHLATEAGPEGRTALPTVFAVGDGASLGGAGGGARPWLRHARRCRGSAQFGAGAAVPGRAVAGVHAARLRRRGAGRHHTCLPLRGDHRRTAAAGACGRAGLAGSAEESHAGGHGAVPGSVLRRHHRPAMPAAAGCHGLRRTARAGEARARCRADAGGGGIHRTAALPPHTAAAPHADPRAALRTAPLRHAGDRRRRGRAVLRLFSRPRRRRRAGGRAR
jgi:NADPH-dependent 2,4-dienoyl-CoA reductase/sulfur reductase-like enzyme